METKIIKEEIPEKEFSEADRTASLRSRSKGSSSSNKSSSNDRTTCKAPDSPEGARLSATSQQTPTPQNVSSQSSNQNNSTPHNLVTRSSQSPNPAMAQHSPPSSRVAGGVNGSTSPVHGGSPDNTVTTPPLSLTLDSNHVVSTNPAHSTGQYLNYSPANTLGSFRQLNKVKRFLCTLVQFGADIGPEIGDRVRSLVLSLVSSNLSIEEFHQALQEVTNFPLRPFVLPFLRTHLPLLQREIQSLARASKQSSLQYVRTHEHLVLDPTFSPSEASEIFLSTDPPVVAHKRRASDSFYENGITANGHSANASLTTAANQHETNEYASPPNKRQMTHHQNPFLLSTTTGVQAHPSFFLPNLGNIALNNMQNLHYENYAQNYSNNTHVNQPQLNVTSTSNRTVENDNNEMTNSSFQNKFSLNFTTSNTRGDEEWKNIHVMLNCILSMVEKTKRALSILQQRNCQDQTTDWLRKQDIGVDLKKAANEIMIQAIRQTEDRVAEVKRKAEEAVQEVKKQAVIELQKAVQLAEAKASELVASERAKMEKVLLEVRKPGNDEVLQTHHADGHDSSQSPPISSQTPTSSQNSCWNCGRKANETCSGCNVARYCGAFCQHKDWENHHSVCGQQQSGTKQTSLVSMTSNNSVKHQTNNNAVCSTVKSHGGTVLNSAAIARENGKSSRSSSDNSGSSRGNTPVSSTNLNTSITATPNSTGRRSERDVDRATSLIAK